MSRVEQYWVEQLLQAIPALWDHIDPPDLARPYVIFGLLAGYVRDCLAREPIEMTAIEPALTFMAEMAQSEDDAVYGLLAVGALEGLIGNWQNVEWSRPRFTPRLRHLFD